MTRIRYNKNEQGLLVSAPILAGTQLVQVELDVQNTRFRVLDATSGQPLHDETASSEQTLKIAAKRQLRSMGASFNDEVRNKQVVILLESLPEPVLVSE